MPEIFNVFTFFPCKPFSTWKRKTMLCSNPIAMHIFCRTRVFLSESVQQFWKCWLMNTVNQFCFLLYLEKVENRAKFWETKMMELTMWLPNWDLRIFWLPISEIWRGKFFLEKSVLRNWAIFLILTWPSLWRSSVTRIRWPDTMRSFWWKLDENQLNGVRDIQPFFCFSIWHIFHLENGD